MIPITLAFFQDFFSGAAKSIVMQIFLLFFEPNFRGQKSLRGEQLASGGVPPAPSLVEENQFQVVKEEQTPANCFHVFLHSLAYYSSENLFLKPKFRNFISFSIALCASLQVAMK